MEAKTNPLTLKLASKTTTEIDQIWNSLEMNFGKMMSAANNSKTIDLNDRVKFRYEVSTINDRCVAGTLQLVKASGGATVFLGHEITNKFIDIMMTQVHIANISDPLENDYGASILGIQTENLML